MDTLKIGQVIISPQERDAVHMAIAPVEAGQKLKPGTYVTLVKGIAYEPGDFRSAVGVVDPFLTVDVAKG